jgi:endonuclease G
MKTRHIFPILLTILTLCVACMHINKNVAQDETIHSKSVDSAGAQSNNNQFSDIEDTVPLVDIQGLEIPSYAADEDLYTYKGFVSSYNHKTLVPNWVAYCLTDKEVEGTFSKSYSFSRDPQVKGKQASREDYSNSGYDKGHMAPRADMKWDQEAYYQTFYFTNVCPQNHTMNAGCWSKLEQQVRDIARHYGTVYVVVGPIFDSVNPKTIGDAEVAVPDRFFKALLVPDNGSYHAIAFIMSNSGKKQKARTSAIPVDRLERIIKRDLFPTLEDKWEKKAESAYNWEDWDY